MMLFLDVCNNTHPWCGDGWPKHWCFVENDANPVEQLCPALCGVCGKGAVTSIGLCQMLISCGLFFQFIHLGRINESQMQTIIIRFPFVIEKKINKLHDIQH